MLAPFRSISLTTTHLSFSVRTTTPLKLDTHSGAALRGSFFHSLWQRFCAQKSAPTCAACSLHATCPVSALVAPLREEHPQGQDIPRPYVILPPQGEQSYQTGEQFSFGITLMGSNVSLLPYILLSLRELEAEGVGPRLEALGGQRGRFRVERVDCYHPFTQQRQTIYELGQLQVQAPVVTVAPEASLQRAATLNKERLTLQFVTPLRLIDQDHLVKHALFRPLMQRLLDRFLALERHYGHQELTIAREEKQAWLEHAEGIRCTNDQTHWEEVKSYSQRQRRSTPIGGLLGTATFEGDLTPFLDLLVLGELIHVGKNVVKGDGCYHILSA